MSFTPRNIRNVAIGAGCVGTAFYFAPANIFRTKAVKRIEDRWSSGGGARTHTPATGTKRGDPNDETPRHADAKGVDTEYFKENFSSQTAKGSGIWPEKFYESHYNNPKGK
ncbi:hypothetical protein BU16DRAFT_480839 [Lophium mytilinum]|uniref:Uncharacterized protein n=1 Tax=Lophium mytilinum TaxID=390894 RepID=A0A6A6R5L4_9PEZI|nr:hypothetical protein BU16DRAFT_480839 [Lophium mytilinum]